MPSKSQSSVSSDRSGQLRTLVLRRAFAVFAALMWWGIIWWRNNCPTLSQDKRPIVVHFTGNLQNRLYPSLAKTCTAIPCTGHIKKWRLVNESSAHTTSIEQMGNVRAIRTGKLKRLIIYRNMQPFTDEDDKTQQNRSILWPLSLPGPFVNVNTPYLPIRLLQFVGIARHPLVASFELFELRGAVHEVSIAGHATAKGQVDHQAHVAKVRSGAVGSLAWESDEKFWKSIIR
jgi:hypothetical protein